MRYVSVSVPSLKQVSRIDDPEKYSSENDRPSKPNRSLRRDGRTLEGFDTSSGGPLAPVLVACTTTTLYVNT